MTLVRRFSILALAVAALSGCGPSYSPNTYASNAAQQANKVDPGVVVGVRKVGISAAGTVGTVTGAAAGGIAGSQAAAGPVSALTALGGSLVGGIAGSTVEHATADTAAFEYIIRKPNGDLISVTQKDKTPLALGQKVLVIAGNQARIVPDYTVSLPPPGSGTEPATTDAHTPDAQPGIAKPYLAPAGEAKPAAAPQADTHEPDAKPAGPGFPDAHTQVDIKVAAPDPTVTQPTPVMPTSANARPDVAPGAATTR